MEESPNSRMTLRQALHGKWQIPLFAVALAAFVIIIVFMRPGRVDEEGFEQKLATLNSYADSHRFSQFYESAESLRLEAQDDNELGRVHGLTARTRVKQLRYRRELGVGSEFKPGAEENYKSIIYDYSQALNRNWVDPDSKGNSEVFHDLSLAHWALGDCEESISLLEKAISLTDTFDTRSYIELVKMYLSSRPSGYLTNSLAILENLLTQPEPDLEEKGWAFVRKADVLIMQNEEDQALEMLNQAGDEILASGYADEIVLLRGRALRNAGELDRADLLLRDLMEDLNHRQRGDLHAQTLLELGKINYSQFRDLDAAHFYENVMRTQLGTDWYVAAVFGLAQCAAIQQRYEAALEYFTHVLSLLEERPFSRAVDIGDVRSHFAMISQQLALRKEFSLALQFMALEKQIIDPQDITVAKRFARVHESMAKQLKGDLDQSLQEAGAFEPTETEIHWSRQQRGRITSHFEEAAQEYLRIAKLAIDNDDLYGSSLWNAAVNYDLAGNVGQAISMWRRIVREREGEPHWPMALFHLGQAYRAIGEYGDAIDQFQLLQRKHPQSTAVYQAMVPLARCYMAIEPPNYEKAVQILLSVRKDPALTPLAPAYRDATFELGNLYSDHQAYTEAINILHEAIDRYSDDKNVGKALFLVADAYRRSWRENESETPSGNVLFVSGVAQEDISNRHRKKLSQARDFYGRAIDSYRRIPEGRRTELDSLYLKHSLLYKADCLFQLGQFQEALVVFEEVALRHQLTPTALVALMQVVNIHYKLNQMDDARAAKQRALWQFKKIPEDEFSQDDVNLSRDEWEQWFAWMSTSGL